MARPRREIMDPQITRHYHISSECVRGAFLLVQGGNRRMRYAYERMRLLEEAFAIDVVNFNLTDNQFQLILRLNPEQVAGWSPREVVERWARVHPPHKASWAPLELTEQWIAEQLKDKAGVEASRRKLADASQFMKDLKQDIAQVANREDRATGHFWAERFRSVALMDGAALLAAMAYVDLYPFADAKCDAPKAGEYTSLKERAEAYRAALEADCDQVALDPGDHAETAEAEAEAGTWLVPVQDRSEDGTDSGRQGRRTGLLRGLRLSHYLQLVDAAARLIRDGQVEIDERMRPMMQRLNLEVGHFVCLFRRLLAGRLRGSMLAATSNRGGATVEMALRPI